MGPCIDDLVCMENPYLGVVVTEKCSCINDTTRTVLFIHIYTSTSIVNFVISITKIW